MKTILFPIIAAILIAGCSQQSQAPEAAVTEQTATPETPLPKRPVGEPFKTPLPQGVALIQPHNATVDTQVENANGTIGRRVEFEYLDGNASQAMQEFSQAMATAGFATVEGPSDQEGVIRQVFKKPGYGSAFARAQAQDPARRKHQAAIGFVVVAWPEGEGQAAAPAAGQ